MALVDEVPSASEKDIAQIMLIDPETGDKLEIESPLVTRDDGSYSFFVVNAETGKRWVHTVSTEEVKPFPTEDFA
jgi:hypothetical protein